jgi:hypothetical protein
MSLLVRSDYNGWVMLEASSKPDDRVAALAGQVRRFYELRSQIQKAINKETRRETLIKRIKKSLISGQSQDWGDP